MSKYNIHIDPSLPNDEEISKFKDFEGLYEAYEFEKMRPGKVRPLLQRYGSYAAAVALLVLSIPVIAYIMDATREMGQEITLASNSWEVPFSHWEIDAKAGGTLQSPENSLTIEIPPAAFEDQNGKEVTGKTSIRYRFLSEASQFLLSKIQTHYDSASRAYPLETLGAIELKAYQKDKPLRLKENALISIGFTTADDKKEANLYSLGTSSQDWEWIGKDSVISPDDLLAVLPPRPKVEYAQDVELDTLISKLSPSSLRKPSVPMPPFAFTKIVGNVPEDEKEKLKTAWWEYLGAPSKDPHRLGILRKKWQDIRIRPTAFSDQYEILLRCKTRSGKIQRYLMPVQALMEVNSEELARRHYENSTRLYENKLKQRRQLEGLIARNQQAQVEKELAEKRYWQQLRKWENEYGAIADSIVKLDAKRSFSVSQLGTFTLGRKLSHLQPYLQLFLLGESGEAFPKDIEVFFVNDRFNALFPCETNSNGSYDIPLMEAGNSSIWISTPQGEVYVSSSSDYRNVISADNHIPEIKLRRIEKPE